MAVCSDSDRLVLLTDFRKGVPILGYLPLEDEIARFNLFQRSVLGAKEKIKTDVETDIKNYAKYILKEGSTVEKRELLAHLRSRIVYKDKTLTLVS